MPGGVSVLCGGSRRNLSNLLEADLGKIMDFIDNYCRNMDFLISMIKGEKLSCLARGRMNFDRIYKNQLKKISNNG